MLKQMLRTASDNFNHSGESDLLLENVRKVAFIATPHSGSGHATLLDRVKILIRPSTAVESLVKESPHLLELNRWYRNWATDRRIANIALCETRAIPFVGQVVSLSSADPGIARCRLHFLEENHISICRPPSADHETYGLIKAFIKETSPNAKGIPRELLAFLQSPRSIALAVQLAKTGSVNAAVQSGVPAALMSDIISRWAKDGTEKTVDVIHGAEMSIKAAIGAISDLNKFSGEAPDLQEFTQLALSFLENSMTAETLQVLTKGMIASTSKSKKRRVSIDLKKAIAGACVELAVITDDIQSALKLISLLQELYNGKGLDPPRALLTQFQEQWLQRGKFEGSLSALKLSICIGQETEANSRDNAVRAIAITNLAEAYHHLGILTPGNSAWDLASHYCTQAEKLVDENNSQILGKVLYIKGRTVRCIGERDGSIGDLEVAIEIFEKALLCNNPKSILACIHMDLGIARIRAFELGGKTQLLESGVSMCKIAAEELNDDETESVYFNAQNSLCAALITLGQETGEVSDFDDAILAAREAIRGRPRRSQPYYWATSHNNLGVYKQRLVR